MSLWICRSYPTWAAAVLCQGFWRAVKISETGKLKLFRSDDEEISQLANSAVSVKVQGGRATLGEPGNTSHPSSHLKFWGWKLLSEIWGCGNKRTNWSLNKQIRNIAQPWCLGYKFIHFHVFVYKYIPLFQGARIELSFHWTPWRASIAKSSSPRSASPPHSTSCFLDL